MAIEQRKKTGLGTLGVVTSGLCKNKRMLEHNSMVCARVRTLFGAGARGHCSRQSWFTFRPLPFSPGGAGDEVI